MPVETCDGSKDKPCATCRDLFQNPNATDGNNLLLNVFDKISLIGTYFIDPNGGSVEDAIEVECYIIEHVEWTCIKPQQKIHVCEEFAGY